MVESGKENNRRKREPKEKSDLMEKLVHVNRVAKVVKGGRRFSFAALVVVGDGKGKVGFGSSKAKEVPDAVAKATQAARNNMVHIPMKEGRTLHHDINYSFGAAKVVMKTAPVGTGVIAGGAMRSIFEVLGMQDVVAKSLGSTNPHNLIRATINGLKSTLSPKVVAARRGKKISELSLKRKLDQNLNIDNPNNLEADTAVENINNDL